MRNMVQLLGGVAVAGVVAAGSTAFTASGLTSTIPGDKVVVGGVVTQQTVVGAVLSAAVFSMDATNADEVTGVTLTLAGASGGTLSTSSVVKAKITGTAGGAGGVASGAAITCTNATATTWTCAVGGTGYFTAVSALDVSVVAA